MNYCAGCLDITHNLTPGYGIETTMLSPICLDITLKIRKAIEFTLFPRAPACKELETIGVRCVHCGSRNLWLRLRLLL